MRREGLKTSWDRRRRSRSRSSAVPNIDRHSLTFRHLKQDNYEKKAGPRRCFPVRRQSFLDIIKTNLFKIFTKSRLFSPKNKLQNQIIINSSTSTTWNFNIQTLLLKSPFSKNRPLADSFIESRCPFVCQRICLSVCPLPMQFFSRPLIGPQVT